MADTKMEMARTIATKLFNLEPCSNPVGRCDGAAIGQCYGTRNKNGVVVGSDLVLYSASIEAAWLVVEKMQEKYGFEGGHSFLLTAALGRWYCVFPKPSWGQSEADTAAEAICLAALSAIAQEPGNG